MAPAMLRGHPLPMRAGTHARGIMQAPRAARALAVRPPARSIRANAGSAAEMRTMSVEQLDQEVDECRKKLLDLRVKQSRKQDFKPHEFKMYKKQVAKLLTVRREKEIADGVSKKDSRYLARMAALDKFYQNLPAGTQPRYTQRNNEELKAAYKQSASSGERMKALEAAREEAAAKEE